ncbi:MAG: FAD-binding oxidoreductase, partial [Endozoicomonas sp.]
SENQQDQFLIIPKCCNSIAGSTILEKKLTERNVTTVTLTNRFSTQSSVVHLSDSLLEHDRTQENINVLRDSAWQNSSELCHPHGDENPPLTVLARPYKGDDSQLLSVSPLSDIQRKIKEAQQTQKKISLLGSGYSQGGQTTGTDTIQIDMKTLNRVINIDREQQEVTVQAGISWKELQQALTPHNLSISAMQSYSDFSVGGSIGVNAHGQDVIWNPVSSSLLSMRVLLTDGRYLTASRTENPDLFKALIGSYGLIGIIIEAKLKVVPNTLLLKKTTLINTRNYLSHFHTISNKPGFALHSARVSINAPVVPFRYSISVNYYDTGVQASAFHESKPPQYTNPKNLNLLKKSRILRQMRATIEYYFLEKESVMTRNQAMGESVQAIKNNVPNTKDILQEYFIPPENLMAFMDMLKQWHQNHPDIILLNATIRKVCTDSDSLLPYAPIDCFAVVLFMNIPDAKNFEPTMEAATQHLIDSALSQGGRYYLPYALYARQDQVFKAYPEAAKLAEVKDRWDPGHLLDNHFYQKYFPEKSTLQH